MKPENILLTIAIPTYNRLDCLKELLPELMKQCKSYPEIEILVSDNCTTDGTSQYVRDITKTNSQMRFRINSANVGADENFVRCVEAAQGNYVWLFGDDEILCDGAIEIVINTLKTHPVSLLIIGHNCRIGYLGGSHFFRTYKEFVNFVNPKIVLDHTLITCNIFRKSIFDTRVARKYISSNYGHMRAMIESLKIKGSIYLLDAPVIIVREFGEPFQEPLPTNLILKHIWYLLYLGTIYPKIFWYSCRYVVGIPFRRVFNPGK